MEYFSQLNIIHSYNIEHIEHLLWLFCMIQTNLTITTETPLSVVSLEVYLSTDFNQPKIILMS